MTLQEGRDASCVMVTTDAKLLSATQTLHHIATHLYHRVMTLLVNLGCSRCVSVCLASPKSASLRCPSLLMSRLDALRSRCTTPLRWQCASPLHSCFMYSLICTPSEVFQNQLVLRQDTECCLDGGFSSVAVQEQCRRINECQLARAICDGEG